MFRTAMGLGILAVLSVATGCTMCCHPYDNCGPVYDGNGCESCNLRARAGSILAGTASETIPASETETIQKPTPAKRPEATPNPTPAKMSGKTASAVRSRTSASSRSAAPAVADPRILNQIQAQTRPGDVPGSEQIVSVTDRAVESSDDEAVSPQVADGPAMEPAVQSASQGWVARKSSW